MSGLRYTVKVETMKTLRLLEEVIFPDYSSEPIMAKIDTGAASGAIHAEDIEIVKRDDGYYLTFRPFGLDKVVEADRFKVFHVKSSNGISEQRFFVFTQIEIKGEAHPIQISLRDRSNMATEAIIGSRFLRNKFIVDPR